MFSEWMRMKMSAVDAFNPNSCVSWPLFTCTVWDWKVSGFIIMCKNGVWNISRDSNIPKAEPVLPLADKIACWTIRLKLLYLH